MTTLSEIDFNDERYVQVLDKGFVGLIDWMGSDSAVVQAARVSYGTGTKKVQEDRGLIRYLMRHEHTTPFEMCEVKFHIRLPIFVMRQLIRHRTAQVNEYSGRYSVMTDEFYMPETFQKQSTTNKQGREDSLDEIHGKLSWMMESVHRTAYEKYEKLLEVDVARETARAVLPVSNYTEAYWKCNIKNFLHMAWLRMDTHAQWEIQEFAKAMYGLVKPLYPSICEAYEDYKQQAVRLSRMEAELTKTMLAWKIDEWDEYVTDSFGQSDKSLKSITEAEKLLCEKFGLTKRELTEFKEKWA
jgi:thymidylate synthase (FAD)